MEFSLSFECSQAALQRTLDLQVMNVVLRNEFVCRSFGDGVDRIYIGIIAVGTASFIANKKRRITYNTSVNSKVPGEETLNIGNCVSLDVLPDYDIFMTLSIEKLRQYISLLIFRELVQNKGFLLRRIREFDAERFLNETDQIFIKNWGYFDPMPDNHFDVNI
jgi:hypothetical protein